MTDEITTGVTGGEVAAPQTEQIETTQGTSVENSAVAEQKPVQDSQTNAAFAQMRREAEQYKREVDEANKIIADLYAEHGINDLTALKQAYQQRKQAQEAQKVGVDPQFYQQFQTMEQKLNAIEREKTLVQQDTALASDPNLGELYKQFKPEVQQLANQYSVDYDAAFTLILREKLPTLLSGTKTQAEQSAIQKLTQNAQASTGSLSGGDVDHNTSIAKMPKSDFSKLVEQVKRGEINSL